MLPPIRLIDKNKVYKRSKVIFWWHYTFSFKYTKTNHIIFISGNNNPFPISKTV